MDAEGNVGVGITNPQSKLHVAGLLSLGAEGDNSVVRFETASGKTATIGVQDDGDEGFFVYTSDEYRLNVNQNGNVGIGTQTPGQKLSVDGVLESITGGFKFPDGTVQTTAATGATGDGHSLDAVDGDPVDAVFVDAEGNVGIGTTSPGYALDVDTGTVRADRYRMDDNKLSALYTADGSHLQVGSQAPGSTVGLQSGDDNDALFVASNGNVGIGTTSPDVPLHIANGSDVTGTGGGRFLLGSATGSGLRMDGNEIQAFTSGTSVNATLFLQHEGDGNVDLVDETLYVKSDGTVGIGTTSSSAKLSVITTKNNQPAVFGKSSDSFGGDFRGAENNGISKAAVKIVSGTQIMLLDGNEIDATTSTLYLNKNSSRDVAIAKGGGNVGIGTSNPLAELHIKQPFGSPSGGIRLEHPDGDYWETYVAERDPISTARVYRFALDGTVRAQIEITGSYTEISDRRLKKNIQQLEPVLDRVLQLSPSRYQFKDSPASTPASIGFIAQEVEELFPEIVAEMGELKGLAYDKFGVIAIKAIQEQQELIKALQQRIEDLEARLK